MFLLKHTIIKGDTNANKYEINEPFTVGAITHEDIGIKNDHNIKYLSVMLYLLFKTLIAPLFSDSLNIIQYFLYRYLPVKFIQNIFSIILFF